MINWIKTKLFKLSLKVVLTHVRIHSDITMTYGAYRDDIELTITGKNGVKSERIFDYLLDYVE